VRVELICGEERAAEMTARSRKNEVHEKPERAFLEDLSDEGLRHQLQSLIRVMERDRDETLDLTPREKEIAEMVAIGLPNKTIAAQLDISSWTVSAHIRRVFAKLDLHSRAALAARIAEDEERVKQRQRAVRHLTAAADLPLMQATLLGEAIDHAALAGLVIDTDERVLAVNDYACALTGFSRAELLDRAARDLVGDDTRTLGQYDEVLRGTRSSGRARIRRKGGPSIVVSYRAHTTTIGGVPLLLVLGEPVPGDRRIP
jgi:PAS domain S-box-containing protein